MDLIGLATKAMEFVDVVTRTRIMGLIKLIRTIIVYFKRKRFGELADRLGQFGEQLNG